jgi:hypothetical protein
VGGSEGGGSLGVPLGETGGGIEGIRQVATQWTSAHELIMQSQSGYPEKKEVAGTERAGRFGHRNHNAGLLRLVPRRGSARPYRQEPCTPR